MTSRSRLLPDVLLLAGFCAFLFFFGLSAFGLLGADEPRYAQVAREMFAGHHWITPILGGRPWLEKPVLYYWQAILAYHLFGVRDWVARVPSAADATLLVAGVYLFLRRFRPGFELDGALITASAAGVIGFARAAAMDMPLAATFSLALLAWFAWHESRSRRYLAVAYIFLGLATLAKGPVGLCLAAVIVVLFALVKGDVSIVTRTLWFPGILLFCLVALPWYVAAQIRNPDFFRVFILEHNLARFGTSLYHHPQPFWFYIPVTLVGLFPWVVFSLAAIVECIRNLPAARRQIPHPADAFGSFLLLWLFVPVLFFSVSQSKLPGYILPALPAGTLLVAEYVRRRIADEQLPQRPLVFLHAIVAASPLVPALMLQYILRQHRLPWGRATALSLGLAAIVAVAMAISLLGRSGFRVLRFVTLVPVVLTVAAVLRLNAVGLDSDLSARPLAAAISRIENATLPTAVFRVRRETEYGLQFYRNQSIARYERGEVPSGEHIVVAPQGAKPELQHELPGRRISYLGTFEPQGLDYYWVAAAKR